MEQLGHYQIIHEVGTGPTGTVYQAYEPSFNRWVAIKVLDPALASDDEMRERFLDEARAMAELKDPQIAQIYSIGNDDGLTYVVMEWIEGESLQAWLRIQPTLAPSDAQRVVLEAAQALAVTYKHGATHHDIKPANLFLTPRGKVKITDFGLSTPLTPVGTSRTSAGRVTQVNSYLPPEVILGKASDARSDIYSLGVVLFECLAGHQPFQAKSPRDAMHDILTSDLPDIRSAAPQVDEHLSSILSRMTAKDPDARFQDYDELIVALTPEHREGDAAHRPVSDPGGPSPSWQDDDSPRYSRVVVMSAPDASAEASAPSIHPRVDETEMIFPVWFATNRNLTSRDAGQPRFGCERSASLTRGRADVYIPKAHRPGRLTGTWWEKLRRADIHYGRVKLEKTQLLEAGAFWKEIQDLNAQETKPHSLVFIHGYNNTFENAAIRAAQLARDLRVTGATAFFSWPSCGRSLFYMADEATIEASEKLITEFLVEFATQCGSDTVHLIAHSMGNRGLLRAMQRIAADAQLASKVRFSQIFLAAPDVDRDTFVQLAHLYQGFSQGTTLYTSSGDLAVFFSRCLHWNHRAGYFRPYTIVDNIDTIAVPKLNFKLLGHGYFAESRKLLHDIYDVMRHGTPPDQRQDLATRTSSNKVFWELSK